MLDPSRLVGSATRLYGAAMDRLWGEMVPVPERNLTVLSGGERLLGGSFEVAYTPGHAVHHVCYLHRGTAFVGDVGGVRITPSSIVIPPTPPPDIDIEAWHESIALIRSWRPQRLAIAHFGCADDVERHLDELGDRLDEWSVLARDGGKDAFTATVRQTVTHDSSGDWAESYQLAAPVDQLYAGYARYWSKRATGPNVRPAARP